MNPKERSTLMGILGALGSRREVVMIPEISEELKREVCQTYLQHAGIDHSKMYFNVCRNLGIKIQPHLILFHTRYQYRKVCRDNQWDERLSRGLGDSEDLRGTDGMVVMMLDQWYDNPHYRREPYFSALLKSRRHIVVNELGQYMGHYSGVEV